MIIVIDGPAGSGKSSSAKEIARRLNINFLDSGALYRGVTYIWLELGQPPADEFFHFLEHIRLEVEYKEQQFVLRYNNNDITNEIRSNRVAEHVSHIAARPQVRNYANNLMRDRKSTRLNSSHVAISYAGFCLKKKRKVKRTTE